MKITYCDGCGMLLKQSIDGHKISFFDIEDLCHKCHDKYIKEAWDLRNKLKGVKSPEEQIDENIDKMFGVNVDGSK